MRTLKKKILAVVFVITLMIPSATVFAASANNNQAAVQVLAQQIVSQQVAAFQAQGQTLTPEQMAILQQNALIAATQQMQVTNSQQLQAQQAQALQAQQAQALQAQQAQALQVQQMQALQAQQKAASVTTANASDNVVAYLSATGECYHRIPNCGRMNPDKAIKTTVGKAKMGHLKCSKCW